MAQPEESDRGITADQMRAAVTSQAANQGPSATVRSCRESLTWIEIRLVDMEGNPVANEPYRIKLPDGGVRQGKLDSNGRAREEGIRPGTCQVCFPELDQDAWERV